ncbi:hypothetical protein C9374_003447 [Naegleria lovaniensis]|uniref:Uncharacterized protein n=1 Tax=Naegleria lovaniensis TaxID=51637 RepID=A0AA88KPQ1_NAELO|nr:uncharacterized protein C9374_003447 [Naegleria lovaniensis]KAG2385632.1 hypothetical protein C9374_003447 [Naegleria lovaniensis]
MNELPHHILLDGKVDYELEELSRILLHHEQYETSESRNGQDNHRDKLKWWEEAKFLKEQGFCFPETNSLQLAELEELKFECEDEVLPKYLLPLSSSRRDLEIMLNQLMNLIEKDPVMREWLVEKSLQLLKIMSIESEVKHLLAYFPIILQNIFELKDGDLREKSNVENSEETEIIIDPRVEENIMKSVLFSLKEKLDQKHVIIELCFAFLYLRSKEYDKAEICLIHVTTEERLENDLILNYFKLLLGHVLRINFKLDVSAYYFRKIISEKPFQTLYNMHLYSAIYLWLGEIMESMDYGIWAAECYLTCCTYFLEHPNFNHPFVTIGFVYLKIAELFMNSNTNIEYCKVYYHRAYFALERQYLRRNKTFIELSPFTTKYNRASIAIRLGCIYYLEKQFSKSIDLFTEAEKLLLTLRFETRDDSEKSNEASGNAPTSVYAILQTLHRKIAINLCRLGQYQNAARYVTYRLVFETSPQGTELDYQKQLNLMLQEKEREKKERQSHAKGVIAQENIVCFLALCLISFHKERYAEVAKYCELIFKTNDLDKEVKLPLLTFQKLFSIVVMMRRYDLAQLVLSKYLLSNKSYALGFYALFLLSIKNRDENAIIGSWKKFEEAYYASTGSNTIFEPMREYWPFMILKILNIKLPISRL